MLRCLYAWLCKKTLRNDLTLALSLCLFVLSLMKKWGLAEVVFNIR